MYCIYNIFNNFCCIPAYTWQHNISDNQDDVMTNRSVIDYLMQFKVSIQVKLHQPLHGTNATYKHCDLPTHIIITTF